MSGGERGAGSKKERLTKATEERDAADRRWRRADQVWNAADVEWTEAARAWREARRKVAAIEAEKEGE